MQGKTPLMHAVVDYYGLHMVKLLVSKGADVNSKDNEVGGILQQDKTSASVASHQRPLVKVCQL